MEWMDILIAILTDPAVWIALITLTVLEIVLGIDNVVFIAVMAARVGPEQERRTRTIGIFMALFGRLALVSLIFLMPYLKTAIFTLPAWVPGEGGDFTYKSLVFLIGGAFLIYKAVEEIHAKLEGEHHEGDGAIKGVGAILVQIFILNMVFSIDSVLTAIGMVEGTVDPAMLGGDKGTAGMAEVVIMLIAILVSTIVMLVSAAPLTRFMERHPAVKILAFAFLLLIGFVLVLESLHIEIEKSLIYAAMGFAIGVEALQIYVLSKSKKHKPSPVALRKTPPRGAKG